MNTRCESLDSRYCSIHIRNECFNVLERVERPFVLTDEKGQPVMFYVAVADENVNGNIAIPIERDIVKE